MGVEPHFIFKTQGAKGSMTFLTVEFMLFKLVTDVISYFIGEHLLKHGRLLEDESIL